MNTCKGWKVITTRNRKSLSLSSGNSQFCVSYPPNVEVYPKIGKLFFFRYRNDAERFAMSFETIVKCIANNPKKAENFLSNFNDCDLKCFWEGISDKPDLTLYKRAPTGTYFADSIKCLE